MIRKKFETMISVSKHYIPFGLKIDDVLFDERLDSESGNQGSNLNTTVNKLCGIQQIVIGFASVFSAIL